MADSFQHRRGLPERPHRAALVTGVFVVWSVLAVAVLWELGRLPCGLPRSALADRGWAFPGWRAEHWLPDAGPTSAQVRRHLEVRGPVPELHETIWLAGDATRWAPYFRRAGWQVRLAAEEAVPSWPVGAVPAVALVAPGGRRAQWSALHDVAGLSAPDAVPLDLAVFRAVAGGKPVPPLVPAGCSL